MGLHPLVDQRVAGAAVIGDDSPVGANESEVGDTAYIDEDNRRVDLPLFRQAVG